MLTLHIGMPKTGTSAIQQVLARAAPVLITRGIDYPHLFRHEGGHAHHALSAALLGSESLRNPLLSTFFDYLKQSDRHFIVSSEAFTNALSPKKLAIFSEFIQACSDITPMHLVISLRRVDTFMESMYLQSIKVNDRKSTIQEYLSEREEWAATLLQSLATIKNRFPRLTLRVIEYRGSRAFKQRILSGLALDGYLSVLDVLPVVNRRPGLKAQIVLFRLDEFSQRIGARIDRSLLFADLSSGRFAFPDDIYSYSVMPYEDAFRFHTTALAASESDGIASYAEFFGRDDIEPRSPASLDPDLLSRADLGALVSWVRGR